MVCGLVNWCIARGNSKDEKEDFTDDVLALTTRSAASGSFRCWKETTSPKKGDLAVFAQKGTESRSCSGQGTWRSFSAKPATR